MPMATNSKQHIFKREVFTISRELEYFSESELVTQTGYGPEHWWPGVLIKELVDNSLDACEQAGVVPQIAPLIPIPSFSSLPFPSRSHQQ
jgi:DNA topoisomerase VI subunit B